MSKKEIETLASIDPTALETASGGRRAAGASSSRAADTAILDALKDVELSVREMSAKQANTPTNNTNDMMAMMMMTTLMGQNNGGGNCRKRRC